MFKQFYRLMVVALGFFVASSCGEATPKYGNIYTDYDDGTVDEDVADEDAFQNENPMPDDDSDDKEWSDPAYGCTRTYYKIEGLVTTLDGAPIVGVVVVRGVLSDDEKIDDCLQIDYCQKTDDAGKFIFSYGDSCRDPQVHFSLSATDVDGDVHGLYKNKTVSGTMDCTYSGGSWGDYHCTNTEVKIELEEAFPDDDNLLSDETTSDDDTLLKD